jgi:cytoskeletal protein CcmA (bactofilin family)
MAESPGAVVGDDASFSGLLTGRDLTVLGRFDGEVEISGRLRVGPKARFKGTARAAEAEVDGEFQGDLRAERLAFGETARAGGVFHAARLSVRDGARVDGRINEQDEPKPAPAAEPQPAPEPVQRSEDASEATSPA